MKIGYVINKATHTSIPVEWASLISEKYNDDVTIMSLYDSQSDVDKICEVIAPSCKRIGFNLKKKGLKGFFAFRSELQNGNYDVVHTHHTLSGALARFIAKGTRKIHTIHANHNSFSLVQNLIIGSTLNRCDLIVANSKSSLNGMKKWQKKRTRHVKKVIINNGVNVERIEETSDQWACEFWKEKGFTDDTFVFAQIGRLEIVKNPLQTLNAFEMLLNEEPNINAKLLFVGDGRERKRLEQCVENSAILKNKVIFTGTLQRDEVYSLMHKVNAMVIPSLYEGFCNALFEGLVCGVPVLVSDIPVFNELLSGDIGIRIDPQNCVDISRKMKNIMATKDDAKLINNKRFAIKEYSSNRCIEKYRFAYAKIVNGGR